MVLVVETVYAHANFTVTVTQDNHWNWNIASRLLWFQLKLTQLRRTWLCDGEVHQHPWGVWHSGQHDQVVHLCHDNRSLGHKHHNHPSHGHMAHVSQHRQHRLWCSFFQAGVICSIENAKCWPILAHLDYFVANMCTFWCTFTGLYIAVVNKNEVCMVIKGRAQKMIFVGLSPKSLSPLSRSSTSTPSWTTSFQHHHDHQYQHHQGHQYHVQHDQEAGGDQGAQQHWEDQVVAFWVQASRRAVKNIMWSIFLRVRTFILLLMQGEKNLSG